MKHTSAIQMDWILNGFIPRGYLIVLAGTSKAGESTLLTALAMAVCGGTSFLGFDSIPFGRSLVDVRGEQKRTCPHPEAPRQGGLNTQSNRYEQHWNYMMRKMKTELDFNALGRLDRRKLRVLRKWIGIEAKPIVFGLPNEPGSVVWVADLPLIGQFTEPVKHVQLYTKAEALEKIDFALNQYRFFHLLLVETAYHLSDTSFEFYMHPVETMIYREMGHWTGDGLTVALAIRGLYPTWEDTEEDLSAGEAILKKGCKSLEDLEKMDPVFSNIWNAVYSYELLHTDRSHPIKALVFDGVVIPTR